MNHPGCTRWALVLVVVTLGLVLVAAATVVVAQTFLQPPVIPTIEVEPKVVRPGDVVVVKGKGWPSLRNLVLVVALSATRDLRTDGLLAVSAAPVALDGTIAAAFIFPDQVPWAALREAWVVVRPGSGDMRAVAHFIVSRARPTPSISPTAGPLSGRLQIQGTIVEASLGQSLLVLRPFDGSPNRGVSISRATLRFLDGRAAALADLKIGVSVAAEGWPDSGGLLLAEQVTILEAVGPGVTPLPLQTPGTATVCPTPLALIATPVPVVVTVPTAPVVAVQAASVVVAPTACVVPVVQPVVVVATPCPPTPCPTACPPLKPVGCWTAEFFCNSSLAGAPFAVRQAEVIDFNWWLGPPISGLPRQGYSVRWSGPWTFPRSSCYRFALLLRGAARLSVDGRIILDLWNGPPPGEFEAQTTLAAGVHNVVLEFRSTDKTARVQLRWEYAGTIP